MTIGVMALIVGLYVMPLLLLAGGHRVRRLPPRRRRAFWGAIIGHCAAALLALVAAMYLPESWTDAARVRGFLGLWSLLLFPVVGGVSAALLTPREAPQGVQDAPRSPGRASRNQ